MKANSMPAERARFQSYLTLTYGVPETLLGHLNLIETQTRPTTPVGVFPSGRTSEGVDDMAGNTWDWTSSGDLGEGTMTVVSSSVEDGMRYRRKNLPKTRHLSQGTNMDTNTNLENMT